jgi:hypothetical protein
MGRWCSIRTHSKRSCSSVGRHLRRARSRYRPSADNSPPADPWCSDDVGGEHDAPDDAREDVASERMTQARAGIADRHAVLGVRRTDRQKRCPHGECHPEHRRRGPDHRDRGAWQPAQPVRGLRFAYCRLSVSIGRSLVSWRMQTSHCVTFLASLSCDHWIGAVRLSLSRLGRMGDRNSIPPAGMQLSMLW